jgi:hypothetical protein
LCAGQQGSPEPSAPAPATTAQSSPSQAAPAPAPAPAPLPDAPGAAQSAKPATAAPDEEQTKRIMGILPNFRSVTAGEKVEKETTRDKFVTASLDNFDYTSLLFAGVIAADSFATKATPEFHQGAAGYGRYFWHTVADQSIENYFVEFIVPQMTHEDPRYFALGKQGGGFLKRTGYSLSRVFVTRTVDGKSTFNTSEIAGSAVASSISNFYYPTKEQTVGTGLRDWGLDITYDAVTFMFHEFWPDIRHAVFARKTNKADLAP